MSSELRVGSQLYRSTPLFDEQQIESMYQRCFEIFQNSIHGFLSRLEILASVSDLRLMQQKFQTLKEVSDQDQKCSLLLEKICVRSEEHKHSKQELNKDLICFLLIEQKCSELLKKEVENLGVSEEEHSQFGGLEKYLRNRLKQNEEKVIELFDSIFIADQSLGDYLRRYNARKAIFSRRNLNEVSQFLYNELKNSSLSLSFYEKYLVFAYLTKLRLADEEAPTFGERQMLYQKIDGICRTFSKNELDLYQVPVSPPGAEYYRVSDRTLRFMSEQEMRKNSQIAVEGHQQQGVGESHFVDSDQYFEESGDSSVYQLEDAVFSVAKDQGGREYMQDVCFTQKIGKEGILAGVFDGHGEKGHLSSQRASAIFQENFQELFQEYQDPYIVLSLLTEMAHAEILRSRFNQSGTTAVVSFVHKGWVYTATVGDSEAFILRDSCFIPCSVIQNWSSDGVRVGNLWDPSLPAKRRYFPLEGSYYTNLSRSLGDKEIMQTRDKKGVIHKPTITKQKLRRNDIVF